jgi:hypothetical protein
MRKNWAFSARPGHFWIGFPSRVIVSCTFEPGTYSDNRGDLNSLFNPTKMQYEAMEAEIYVYYEPEDRKSIEELVNLTPIWLGKDVGSWEGLETWLSAIEFAKNYDMANYEKDIAEYERKRDAWWNSEESVGE